MNRGETRSCGGKICIPAKQGKYIHHTKGLNIEQCTKYGLLYDDYSIWTGNASFLLVYYLF